AQRLLEDRLVVHEDDALIVEEHPPQGVDAPHRVLHGDERDAALAEELAELAVVPRRRRARLLTERPERASTAETLFEGELVPPRLADEGKLPEGQVVGRLARHRPAEGQRRQRVL